MEPNPTQPDAGPINAESVPEPVLDARRRRILFRATHRGTHETDLLVGGFVRERIAGLDDAALDALEEVMELPDADLADWLMGRRAVPAEMETPMLRGMLDAARSRPLRDLSR